jgi:cell division protein FtsW (lipid II flippase)
MREHDEIDTFLNRVCAHIRSRDMHRDIRQELGAHLEERISDKQAEGRSREEAAAWAIAQMGDPVMLGKRLHSIHKPRTYWGLLVTIALLSVMGLLAMWSVDTSYRDSALFGGVQFVQRQSVYVALVMLIMLVLYFWDYRKLRRGSWVLYAITIAGIVATSVIGIEVNGVREYIVIGPISLNGIALSPYLLVIAITGILMNGSLDKAGRRSVRLSLKLLVLGGPCVLYVLIRALPELAMYSTVALVAMGWLTGRWLRSALAALGAAGAGMLFVWNDPYLLARIGAAVFPSQDPLGNGYMYMQQLAAIRSAGWLGHGFGSMPEKLPLIHSDMLLPYLIYSFGWVAGLLLIGAVVWLLARLAHAVRVVREPYGKALFLVLSIVLALQLVYGLAMMSGRVMLLSLPFPFLGYGSHLMMEFAAAGLLLGIYRRKDTIPAHTAAE